MEYNEVSYGAPQHGWKVKRESNNEIECSFLKKPTIFIEPKPRYKIGLLMEEYKNLEWIAYLVGRISEKENFFVEDISVPPHETATGASAEAEAFNVPDNCIGIIHSHNSMGAFHSGTDKDYVDKNYPVSMVIARSGEGDYTFDAISYQSTPCDKRSTVACPVKYVSPDPMFDTEGFMKEAKGNIDKGKYVFTPAPYQSKFPPYRAPTEPDDDVDTPPYPGRDRKNKHPNRKKSRLYNPSKSVVKNIFHRDGYTVNSEGRVLSPRELDEIVNDPTPENKLGEGGNEFGY